MFSIILSRAFTRIGKIVSSFKQLFKTLVLRSMQIFHSYDQVLMNKKILEDERLGILEEYDRGTLRGMFEAAAYDAALRGDYVQAYEVTHGIKTIPALREAIFAA